MMNRDQHDKKVHIDPECEFRHDAEYCMDFTPKTEPFPHTEVRTKRSADAKPWDLSDDLLNWLAWEYAGPDDWYWVFRGVKKHFYPLKSALDRRMEDRSKFGTAHSRSEIDTQTAEDFLLSQFKKAAHHFIEGSMVPDDNNTLEWLALMQHYGTPTRLIDFTRSPYVACFFALEELAKKEPCLTKKAGATEKQTKEGEVPDIEDCAIWAVDARWLVQTSYRRIGKRLRKCTEDKLWDSKIVAKNFDNMFVKNSNPLVLPVVPSRSNPRLLTQQGLFLCPSLAESCFEQNIASYQEDEDMDDHVHKIVIQGRIRTEVLSELRLMNISRASLFPGLDGYASSLAHELEYRSSSEIERLR
ncbi:MAG: FRG domain-containing protein [Desulfomonilaceae bacterium]